MKEAGSGRPIAGATVTLRGTQNVATSDEDGLFVLQDVPSGSAELEVASADHSPFAVQVADGQATAKLELQPIGGVVAPSADPNVPAAPTGGNRTVSGRITEGTSGDVVPGATVQVVGTDIIAISDENGNFELADVPPTDVLLEVSLTGYGTVRLSAAANVNNVAATLKFASSEEIVIIGRTPVLMKTNLANGASTVSDQDLNRVSAPTLDGALTGKVAGANLQTNSGAPGGGTQLRLRGISTINGQSSPLYVIDGVILSNAGHLVRRQRWSPRRRPAAARRPRTTRSTASPTSTRTTSRTSRSSRAPRRPRCTAPRRPTASSSSRPSAAGPATRPAST